MSDTPSRVSPSATETQPVRIGPETPSIACEECGGLSRHYTDCSLFVELPRSPSSPVPSSTPEDFEKLLDAMMHEEGLSASNFSPARDAIRGYVSRLRGEAEGWRLNAENAERKELTLRSRFTQLQSENDEARQTLVEAVDRDISVKDTLRSLAVVASNGIHWRDKEIASLRSQLSRIQQTGLTAEEAVMCLMDMEQIPRDDDEGNTHWSFTIWKAAVAKLKSLAALRSLEGDKT